MSHTELKQLFEVTGTSPRDFIAFSAERGVRVDYSTISRQMSGAQGITAPWRLSYMWFFESVKNGKTND